MLICLVLGFILTGINPEKLLELPWLEQKPNVINLKHFLVSGLWQPDIGLLIGVCTRLLRLLESHWIRVYVVLSKISFPEFSHRIDTGFVHGYSSMIENSLNWRSGGAQIAFEYVYECKS